MPDYAVPSQLRTGLNLRSRVVNLPANTSTQICGVDQDRRYLAILVTGGGRVTLGIGAAAVLNQGWGIAAPGEVGDQGGSMVWDTDAVPINSFFGISPVATSVVVLEG